MRSRVSRVAGALAAVSTLTFAGMNLGGGTAGADTSLLGWTAQADANPLDFVVDNAAGLGGSHPLSEIDIPETTSEYETGPTGHALATIIWPGAVAGNFGSLSGDLPVPAQLVPVLGKLNDPVRAESFYPAGPASATYPSGAPASGLLEMTSHTDANQSWAKSGITDVSLAGGFELKSVEGETTATAGSAAQSTASESFSSLSLAGGLIQIGASSSTASAQSDGNNPSGTSTSHIGAITVAGHQVSVGSDGLVVGPASANLAGVLAIPTPLVNQIISAINLKIVPLAQTETSQAPAEQITSGGLLVSFSLPSNLNISVNCTSLPSQLAQLGIICHLPDELQGLSFSATIGRVTASAIAAQPFAVSLGQSGDIGLLSGTSSTTSTSDFNFATPSSALPAAAAPASTTSPNRGLRSLLPVSLSSPITVGLLLILLAVAVAFGLGLRRLASGLGTAALDATCPLEEEP